MLIHTKLYNNTRYSLPLRNYFKELYIKGNSLKSYTKNKSNIDCMVYNFIDAIKKDTNLIMLTTDNNTETYYNINGKRIPTGIGVVGTRKLLNYLVDIKLIEWYKGYKIDNNNKKNGFVTLTPKLIEIIISLVNFDKVSEHYSENVLRLRDKNKHDIEFETNKETRKMIRELKAYNKFMSTKQVLDRKGRRLSTDLSKIYSEDFTSGGRLYGAGYTYQQLPSTERIGITIDGADVCEIDIRASHISILYAEEGCIIDEHHDPYHLDDNSFVELDPEKCMFGKLHIDKSYNPIRNLIKLTLMVAINAKSRAAVKSVIQDRINKDNSTKVDKLKDTFDEALKGSEEELLIKQDLYGLKYYGISNINIDKLIDAVCNKHEVISEHFFKGSGMHGQRVEGDIFLDVIVDCMGKGIEVIVVHDSVLCKEEHLKVVRESIKQSWFKYVGMHDNLELTYKFKEEKQ